MTDPRAKSRHHPRARRRVVCWSLMAVMLLGGTTMAGETAWTFEQRADKPRIDNPRTQRTIRLGGQILTPRIAFELQSIHTFRRTALPGQVHDHVMSDEMSANVRRGLKRATRRAVKSYLMEAIHLDRGFKHVKTRIRGDGTTEVRSLDFRFGFSSQVPQVSVGTAVGLGSMKFKIRGDGAVGIHYRNPRFGQSGISAGFDGDDTYEIRARIGF